MEPASFLQFFLLLPILGMAVLAGMPYRRENAISAIAFGTLGLHAVIGLLFVGYWFWQGQPSYNLKEFLVFQKTGYEFLIPTLSLPDPNDCHVLAAAIRCNADVIVTANLLDFPETILSQHNIVAQHPDTFISNLVDLKPTRVLAAAEIHRKRLKQPPRTVDEYLETLLKQELSISVCMLRELYDET